VTVNQPEQLQVPYVTRCGIYIDLHGLFPFVAKLKGPMTR
jgi:hypothetical protein